jgi:Tol biopolymer transport system component
VFRTVGGPGPGFPRYDIVLLADGAEPRVVVGESESADIQPLLFDRPSWSPDGRRLVFTVELTKSRGRLGAKTDVHVVPADGSGVRRLTSSGRAHAPVWSSDGRTIAFSQRARNLEWPATGLWILDVEGRTARQVLPAKHGQIDIAGSWSPDGALIAFTRLLIERKTGQVTSAVYVVRPDGTGLRRLADRARDPAWSPDGRTIAIASDRDENGTLSYGDRVSFAGELYLLTLADGSLRRLTRTRDLNEATPSWSPDGAWLAYQRGRVIDNAEGMGIFVIRPDGTEMSHVALDPKLETWYARPSWRPRGKARQVEE